MDVQVQDLIDKIKKDGVGAADAKAAEIIAEAKKRAAEIVEKAKADAAEVARKAKAESERFEKAGEAAIAQAGRNLLISFRDGIEKELAAIVSSEVSKAFDAKMLEKLVPEVVKSWATKDGDSLEVLISEKDCKAFEENFRAALREKISKGCEVKSDASLSAGFKISAQGGKVYYDFSAEAVSDLFSAYLNPRVAAILKAAAKGL